MNRFRQFAALFFVLNFSAWLGRAERHSDDMFVLMGLMAAGGFLAAMVEPRRPWIWGVLVPAGIILGEIWNYIFGTRDPHTGGVAGLCAIAALTTGVASTGAFAGSFIRRTFGGGSAPGALHRI